MGHILRVTKAFSVLSDPNGHVYTPGELVDSSHPHVKGREDCFETVEAHVSARSATVEQATAEPGERRARTRTPRKAQSATSAEATPEQPAAVVEPDES